MQPTHFLCLGIPCRPTFMRDATPAELDLMRQHAAWLKGHLDRGKLLLAGPALDGAFGVGIFKVTDADEMQRILAEDPARKGGIFSRYDVHPLSVGMLAAG